jgi:hypothetical protein
MLTMPESVSCLGWNAGVSSYACSVGLVGLVGFSFGFSGFLIGSSGFLTGSSFFFSGFVIGSSAFSF